MQATTGTKWAAAVNMFGALFGALATVDVAPFFSNPKVLSGVMTGIAAINALLHMMTGNSPVIGGK